MRTVVALLLLALVVGAIVQACQPARPVVAPHLSTETCEQLADAGKLQPDADGWIRCP